MDARREAARRPSAPALALLLPLARCSCSWPRSRTAAARRWGSRSRPSARSWRAASRSRCRARCGSDCRARAAPGSSRSRAPGSGARSRFASISWSLSPGRVLDGRDPRGLRGWRRSPPACGSERSCGAPHRRPAWCSATVAVTVAIYSIAQRSFNSEFIAPAFPRLREPLGYANALAALLVSGIPTALALGSRRELAARAAAAASICLLVVALDPDRLARRHPRDARRDPRRAGAGGPAARAGRRRSPPVRCRRSRSRSTASTCRRSRAPRRRPRPAPACSSCWSPRCSSRPPSARLAQAHVARLPPPTRARVLRVGRDRSPGALVLAGLVLASVRAGGPIALVTRSWNQLTGNGQVSNATGSRFFTFSSNLRYRWWSEAWHAFTLRPIEGFGAGTFNLIDQLSRPDAIDRARGAQLGPAGALGPRHPRRHPGARGARRRRRRLRGRLAQARGRGARRRGRPLRRRGRARAARPARLGLDVRGDHADRLPDPGHPRHGRARHGARALARALAGRCGAAAGRRARHRLHRCRSCPSARATRADTLLAQGRTDPALVESDLAISLDPLSTGALLDRATILQLLGRPKDAAADVRRALRLEPANADTWSAGGRLPEAPLERPEGRVQERAHGACPGAAHRRRQPPR